MSKQRAFEQAKSNRASESLHVGALVSVTGFDGSKMTVDVQPIAKWENSGQWETPPPVLAVPVACFQGGNMIIAPNYKSGDIGVILYMDHDIDVASDKGTLSNPNTRRKHSPDDAIFIGGIISGSFSKPIDDAVVISTLDGSTYLAITSEGIKIKGNVDIDGDITAKNL